MKSLIAFSSGYDSLYKAKAINASFFESKDRWGYFDEVK